MERPTFHTPWGPQPVTVHAPDAPHAVVMLAPALGIRSAYYEQLAEGLAAHGIAVVSADLPGLGDSPVRAKRGVSWDYGHLATSHFPGISGLAGERFPGLPRFWLGHSIGGQIALMHAGLSGEIAGVALVASGVPYYGCWDGVEAAKILAATQTARLVAGVFGWFPGHRFGFGGRESLGWIRDWARVGRTGSYVLNTFDAEAALARCDVPVLACCLAGDDWAPWAAIDHPLGMTASHVERWTLEHDPPPDHNRWPRKTPEPVVERVAAWVEGLC